VKNNFKPVYIYTGAEPCRRLRWAVAQVEKLNIKNSITHLFFVFYGNRREGNVRSVRYLLFTPTP
jgi:hypothetical protein